MAGQNTTTAKYKFLYRFLRVLDGNQVHKLYNIVAGLLDVSVFSKDEIEQLEKRLAMGNTRDRNAAPAKQRVY